MAPDEHVAALLEEAAHRSHQRGDYLGAVAGLTRAAGLSPAAAERDRRLAEAAYIGAEALGEVRGTSRLLDGIRQASTLSRASTPKPATSSRCTSTEPTSRSSPTGCPSASRTPPGGSRCGCTSCRRPGARGRRRRRTRAGGPYRRAGQRGRHPDLGRPHCRLVLHRPVAARDHQRGGGQGDRTGAVGVASGPGAEQLRRYHRRIDRARGLAFPPAAAARRPAPACGAPPGWPPTPAAGARSTGPGTR